MYNMMMITGRCLEINWKFWTTRKIFILLTTRNPARGATLQSVIASCEPKRDRLEDKFSKRTAVKREEYVKAADTITATDQGEHIDIGLFAALG